jgi:hypothetical protein
MVAARAGQLFDKACPAVLASRSAGLGISPEIAWKLAFVASETARLGHR